MNLLHTKWQTSLPKTGSSAVSVLPAGDNLFSGSNGFFFSLDSSGAITHTNSLKDRGNHDVRFVLSEDESTAYLGTDGYVVAVNTSSFETIWQTSLPSTGSNVVNIVLDGNSLFAGSNGFVFMLETKDGTLVSENKLPDRGNHEVRLALSPDSKQLFVGTEGYALGLDTDNLITAWQTSLPKTGDNKISVLCTETTVYAAGNGFIFLLSTDGSILATNNLPDRGNHEVRLLMSADGSQLFAGTDGYAIAVDTLHINTQWQTSLPSTGSNVVNLVATSAYLYAGSNGHVYQIDLSKSGDIIGHNGLPGRGNYEVRLALSPDNSQLFIGTDGYALALDAND